MSFLDVLRLLRDFLNLRRLKVYAISDTRPFRDMTVYQIVDKYSPLSSKLKQLVVDSVNDNMKSEMAKYLAILAILCPSLVNVTAEFDPITNSWEDVLKEVQYEEYKERLGQVELYER